MKTYDFGHQKLFLQKSKKIVCMKFEGDEGRTRGMRKAGGGLEMEMETSIRVVTFKLGLLSDVSLPLCPYTPHV